MQRSPLRGMRYLYIREGPMPAVCNFRRTLRTTSGKALLGDIHCSEHPCAFPARPPGGRFRGQNGKPPLRPPALFEPTLPPTKKTKERWRVQLRATTYISRPVSPEVPGAPIFARRVCNECFAGRWAHFFPQVAAQTQPQPYPKPETKP